MHKDTSSLAYNYILLKKWIKNQFGLFVFADNGKANIWRGIFMQNKQRKVLIRTLITGLIGGWLWSLFASVLYYFNFIEVNLKSYVLRSWTVASWTSTWKGTLVVIIMLRFLSILIGFIYYFIFRKINSMWMGLMYGVVLWGIFALMTQYSFPNIKPLTDFNKESITSSLCIFILYGTFLGYAISFDYYETYTLKN